MPAPPIARGTTDQIKGSANVTRPLKHCAVNAIFLSSNVLSHNSKWCVPKNVGGFLQGSKNRKIGRTTTPHLTPPPLKNLKSLLKALKASMGRYARRTFNIADIPTAAAEAEAAAAATTAPQLPLRFRDPGSKVPLRVRHKAGTYLLPPPPPCVRHKASTRPPPP